METKKSTGGGASDFKKSFKSNVRKRWPIYIGLVIADYAMDFLTGGGLSSFSSVLFLANALLGSLILYFIIIALISLFKRRVAMWEK